MHDESLTADGVPLQAQRARRGGAAELAQALQASRADTLATFHAWERALPSLAVPRHDELNPPLWELGHVGWFAAWWTERNPQWRLGHRADPFVARPPARRPDAEALYDSSAVAHDRRWSLPLPDAGATCAELARQLEATLALLATADDRGPARDDELYFFRLALVHEDMHHEAALYMAQALGLPIAGDDADAGAGAAARWRPARLPGPPAPLAFVAGRWRLGSPPDAGFAFDNEWGAHEVDLGACRIDAQAVRWAEFLPFVEGAGYAEGRWWSPAGREWLARGAHRHPRYLVPPATPAGRWQRWRFGKLEALPLDEPACHLTHFEAEAWCRWAGRRLPTEAEWERAACSAPGAFRWGDVWEWTASPFSPYPGFEPHPYRDYSAPWFDGRPVLRGASFMTQPRMQHPRYRNYFQPGRSDVPAGFRSVSA
jgi:ergothioneine biosynthesis protein EgtB